MRLAAEVSVPPGRRSGATKLRIPPGRYSSARCRVEADLTSSRFPHGAVLRVGALPVAWLWWRARLDVGEQWHVLALAGREVEVRLEMWRTAPVGEPCRARLEIELAEGEPPLECPTVAELLPWGDYAPGEYSRRVYFGPPPRRALVGFLATYYPEFMCTGSVTTILVSGRLLASAEDWELRRSQPVRWVDVSARAGLLRGAAEVAASIDAPRACVTPSPRCVLLVRDRPGSLAGTALAPLAAAGLAAVALAAGRLRA